MPRKGCDRRGASNDGVDENGGDLLEECLTNRQFAVVFVPAVGAYDQRGSGVMVAEGDEGSELAFAAEVFAVEREAFG